MSALPVTVNVGGGQRDAAPGRGVGHAPLQGGYAPACWPRPRPLAAFQAALDLGETVYRAALIEVLMGPMGMVNVVLAAPATDVAVQPHELASLTASLTVQAV